MGTDGVSVTGNVSVRRGSFVDDGFIAVNCWWF